MIKDKPIICPHCQTDDFLYAQPSKLFTYVECDKAEGGCGRQFTLPNDGGDKIKDNLLQQQLQEPLDVFYAGYFGLQEEDDSQLHWTLAGLVSDDKKKELEDSLKIKVEAFNKLKNVKQAKYVVKEYSATFELEENPDD